MSKIVIRPMYKTDPGFRKGMEVAVLEPENIILKKHYDNVLQYIPKQYSEVLIEVLSYNDIDWKLAGYNIDTHE